MGNQIILNLLFIFLWWTLQLVSSDMTCTEYRNWTETNAYAPLSVDCVLTWYGNNTYDPAIFAASRKSNNSYVRLTIKTDGRLILPSNAISGNMLDVIIEAKKGVSMAPDSFSDLNILSLNINYDYENQVPAPMDDYTARFNGLSTGVLAISGFKHLDFSGVKRIGQLILIGSSEGQTIQWPSAAILDYMFVLDMITDRFQPQFRPLKKLKRLTIHSLSAPDPVKDLVTSFETMEFSELENLELKNCHTPDVIAMITPITDFPNLRVLELQGNKISSLPASYEDGFGRGDLIRLINLEDNEIAALPPNFFNFAFESDYFDRYVYMTGNPLNTIGENAFANVIDAKISLSPGSTVSLEELVGVYSKLNVYIEGNITITSLRNQTVGSFRKRSQMNILCSGNNQTCSSVCPTFTPQICEVTKPVGVAIDKNMCNGKFENFCLH